MESIIIFDTSKTRTRTVEGLASRILEELKNGPLILSASRTQSLAKYKRAQRNLGSIIPDYKTQKFSEDRKFIVALAAGPFERSTEVPDWVVR